MNSSQVRVSSPWWIPTAAAMLVLALLCGAMIGPAGPTWWRIPLELLNRLPLLTIHSGVSESEWNIIWLVRMPRVVLAGLVGCTLSIAGASYQGV
ncbi:MAG: iron chelate uptake ABC transporter family permease subunit, partial [Actinobacteria bacterium]|nr:iron chelate uptake ABC transporter family permease subunit [Actinomycetota bacterium]